MLRTASKGLLAATVGASMTAAADVVILPDTPLSSLAGNQAFGKRLTDNPLRGERLIGVVGVTRRAMHPIRAGCTGLQRQQRRTM